MLVVWATYSHPHDFMCTICSVFVSKDQAHKVIIQNESQRQLTTLLICMSIRAWHTHLFSSCDFANISSTLPDHKETGHNSIIHEAVLLKLARRIFVLMCNGGAIICSTNAHELLLWIIWR